MSMLTVRPAKRVEGQLRVPGDKSISHRAVLLAAVSDGANPIHNFSPAEDVARSLEAIQALGVRVSKDQSQVEGSLPSTSASPLKIFGNGWDALTSPSTEIDCGNSGTTMRVLLGLLAPATQVEIALSGDDSLRARPMDRVVQPLRAMGARIDGDRGGMYAPLRLVGAPLVGVDHELSIPSAQVKSALLLAGLRAEGTTSVTELVRSRDHTERMLRLLGAEVVEGRNRLEVKSTNTLGSSSIDIPGDFSSAAFVLAAASILNGSHVIVEQVGTNPTRTGFLEVLHQFGALSTISDVIERSGEPRGTIEIRSADKRPITVTAGQAPGCIDELPLVAVLGAYAAGETIVEGAAELRVKESDRITVLGRALRNMGVQFDERPDGFVVRGGPPVQGAIVDAGGDHRIAMALAVAALGAEGETTIEGWECVRVSYPGFETDLERAVVR